MLLGIITVLSALFAALMCHCSGSFLGLTWLWVLPVSFLGSWLILVLLAFLFLYAITLPLDPKKEYQNDSPFYRRVVNLYIEAIILLARLKINTRGLEQLPRDGRFLLVCNHLNEVDPGILLHVFRRSQLAFISKRENESMFIVGKVMPKLLCQSVNRENDREALKTIIKCIQIIKEDKASIAVFPEGYIKEDLKLHHFRPGVFKIAQKANVPIVVCTLKNTPAVLPNFMRLKPSQVDLHLVGVIPVHEIREQTTVAIGERAYRMMADDLGPELVADE